MVTGIDIVKEQIKIASGEKINLKQKIYLFQDIVWNVELMLKIK